MSSSTRTLWTKHLDQIGVAGSVFSALCCLGTPAVLAILSSIGLGFLINDAILIPLLIVFLLITLVGLYLGMRHHRGVWALVLGAVGAVLLLLSVTLVGSGLLAGIGIAALVMASLLNVWLRMRQLRSPGHA